MNKHCFKKRGLFLAVRFTLRDSKGAFVFLKKGLVHGGFSAVVSSHKRCNRNGRRQRQGREKTLFRTSLSVVQTSIRKEQVKDSTWRSVCHIYCSFTHPLLLPKDKFKQLYCFTEREGNYPRLPFALMRNYCSDPLLSPVAAGEATSSQLPLSANDSSDGDVETRALSEQTLQPHNWIRFQEGAHLIIITIMITAIKRAQAARLMQGGAGVQRQPFGKGLKLTNSRTTAHLLLCCGYMKDSDPTKEWVHPDILRSPVRIAGHDSDWHAS